MELPVTLSDTNRDHTLSGYVFKCKVSGTPVLASRIFSPHVKFSHEVEKQLGLKGTVTFSPDGSSCLISVVLPATQQEKFETALQEQGIMAKVKYRVTK